MYMLPMVSPISMVKGNTVHSNPIVAAPSAVPLRKPPPTLVAKTYKE